MPRAGLLLGLAFSGCLFGAYAADLKCDDIRLIIKRHGDQRMWHYDNPPQYKNRDCAGCYLKQYGDDCMENDDGSESCPRLIQIDQTPADSENWICPRHCSSMPELPYQVKVTKTQSTFICNAYSSGGGCTLPYTKREDQTPTYLTVNMPTAFKILDASSYTYDESADPNTYAVRPISLCKTKRYEDNFNARVVSCWEWHWSGKPTMSHLDALWQSGNKNIHKIYAGSTGINQNTQTISKCQGINNEQTFRFQ
jgi:hypothetical protein